MTKKIEISCKKGKSIGCSHYADEFCECNCHKINLKVIIKEVFS